MKISDILSPESVVCGMPTAGKKQLVSELAGLVAPKAGISTGLIFETLWEREKLSSTGVGYGVAIPHGRLAKLDHILGAFVKLQKPIDFESVDDVPVDLVFVLLTPAEAGADHLKALAKISRVLRNSLTCERLRSAREPGEIYSVLTEPPAGSQAA